jgi:uncharacterized cupin superfamily protein
MRKGLGRPSAREDLFGGKGEVLVWDLLGAADIPPFAAVLACELAPGGRVGTHVQQEHPEIVVVTEGEGSAEIDGERCPIGVGSLIALPLGSTLALANGSGETPLRYLIVKAKQRG